MSIKININNTNHQFRKMNLVTLFDKNNRQYDDVRCDLCGVSGKRVNFEIVEIDGRKKNYEYCPKAKKAMRIKVIKCTAHGKLFTNMTPGSIHDVVSCPNGQEKHNVRGIWVMGVGEPILLLHGEYEVLE